VRWKAQLVWGCIRLRNRKRKIPTQRRVAQRTGLHEAHLKDHIAKLRAAGLLEPDRLRAVDGGWDWYRRDRRGRSLFVRYGGSPQ
jgi:predicted ArsR family transcriptional regulator